ncbi:MAG: mechanosensitive ion channel, partial [Thermoplasmata archaeon]|nr:mechanosensitive ion channel [Thermoplasmata archaeon]
GRFTITVEFWIETTAPVKHDVEEVSIVTRDQMEADGDTLIFDRWDNPLPPPLDNDYGVFLIDVVLWLGLAGLALLVMDPFIRAVTKRTKMQIDDMVLGIVRTPLIILIFLYGAIVSLSVLEDMIGSDIVDLFDRLYQMAFWLIIFYIAYKLYREIILFYGRIIAKRTSTELDDLLVPIVEKIGILMIGLVALGTVLSYLGIDLTLFIAGGVVMSIVIAFAAQETLSNFFSGIFLLSDRPFKKGDTIILGESWYEVRNIGIRSTRLFRFSDGAMIAIPNNKLANEMIANFSNPDDPGKITMVFGVAYGTDPEKVKGIIHGIIDANPHIITDDPGRKPIIILEDLSDNGLLFKLIIHMDDRDMLFPVRDYLNIEINRRFAEAGIEIPFPHMDVRLRQERT